MGPRLFLLVLDQFEHGLAERLAGIVNELGRSVVVVAAVAVGRPSSPAGSSWGNRPTLATPRKRLSSPFLPGRRRDIGIAMPWAFSFVRSPV